MATIIPGSRLDWRPASPGFSLNLDRRAAPLLHVVPDQTFASMWRIRFPDSRLSDMVNLTRAKDAGLHHALGIVNGPRDTKETVLAGPPVSQTVQGLSHLTPARANESR